MGTINNSVGESGQNEKSDVKVVQRLLNKHSLPPLRDLTVDGKAGPNTVSAIRHFQDVVVKMKAPDGRVDPGGKTIRRLNQGPAPKSEEGSTLTQNRQPERAAQRDNPQVSEQPKTPDQRKSHREARRKFVRPSVKETSTTTRIINHIMAKFEGIRAMVISGFLGDTDRFWKINYHWEYLFWMTQHCLKLSIKEKERGSLDNIRSQLLSCSPDPDSGYRTSGRVGHPVDKSSMRDMDRRVKILRQCKRDFKKITRDAGLKDKSTRSVKSFDLAAAPVAHPGTSKHSTGYALDIEGNNQQIKSTAKGLGATVVFDEQSHVHVEFKNMA